MKKIEPTRMKDPTDEEWKIFGQIEILEGESNDEKIASWFQKILGSLELGPDFINRLIRSAQGVIHRAFTNVPGLLDHIHLTVYIPNRDVPDGKTWGFFHTARNVLQGHSAGAGSHLISFYLFIEGR